MRVAIFQSNIKKHGGVVISNADDTEGADFFLAEKHCEQKPELLAKLRFLFDTCKGKKEPKSLHWMEDMLTQRCAAAMPVLSMHGRRTGSRATAS